jgi:hypothetical protein
MSYQKTYDNMQATSAILCGIFFIIIGLLSCYRCMHVLWPDGQPPEGWHKADCIIKKIDVKNAVKGKKQVLSYNIFFEYEFDGKIHTSNDFIFSHSPKCLKHLKVYQPEKSTVCYINPSNIKKAKLYRKVIIWERSSLLFGTPAICGVLGLCCIIYGIIKLKTDIL